MEAQLIKVVSDLVELRPLVPSDEHVLEGQVVVDVASLVDYFKNIKKLQAYRIHVP